MIGVTLLTVGQNAVPPVEEVELEVELEVKLVAAVHVEDEMVSASVETVPPNAKALPVHVTVLPMVIPEASMSVPTSVELAPSDVAAVGAQNTSQADAPLVNATTELAAVVSAPFGLKIYVPAPLRVTVVPTTISIAPPLE